MTLTITIATTPSTAEREPDKVLAVVEARRITNTRVETLDTDSVSTYEIQAYARPEPGLPLGPTGEPVTVQHRYGDGAGALARAALDATAYGEPLTPR